MKLSVKHWFGCLAAMAVLLVSGVGQKSARADAPAEVQGVKAIWIGQDGHDFVGKSGRQPPNPSDTQDIRVRLENLPPRPIEHIRVARQAGGEWQYRGAWGPWAIHMEREGNAPTADIFMEPSHDEDGMIYSITIRFEDQSVAQTQLKTGSVERTLRIPEAVLRAEWIGQDGRDWTSRLPSVGPDGIQDVVIRLTGLSIRDHLKAIRVEVEGGRGPAWEYGVNANLDWNAELFRPSNKSREAELLISPPVESIDGKELKITVWYDHNKSIKDVGTFIAGRSNGALAANKPAPHEVRQLARLAAEWIGQDGSDVTGRGDVRVRIAGLPTDQRIVSAALSNQDGGHWIWKVDQDVEHHVPQAGEYLPVAMELAMQRDQADPTAAELFFQPFRNERDARMTFRIVLEDGSSQFGQFAGGECDPYARGKLPADTSITAKPGDDLHRLVMEFGAVTLSPGIYDLDRALELRQPVTLRGQEGAVLQFTQPDDADLWYGAIYIHADNITLENFAVRFGGVVRWKTNDWGKGFSIIHTHHRSDRLGEFVNLTIRNLDIETAPAPKLEDKTKPPYAPHAIRLDRVLSGRIIGNTIRGGTVDVCHGPWIIADNLHLGAVADTYAWDAFALHYSHDVTVERNRLHADQSPGKVWRFLVTTQWGSRTVVRDNDVRGVGMRDDDVIPNPNAPEIFLTEAYRLQYEGRPSTVSADGRVVQIPMVMWGAARPGTVLAVLDGEHAGQWARIAQPIDKQTFLLDEPLPISLTDTISVATGFVDELYENNVIDSRGGRSSTMQLCGTGFNTTVRNNHFLGGGMVLATAYATEHPGVWGWSWCPFFDFRFEDNIIEDVRNGVTFRVHHHSIHTKAILPGRRFFTGNVSGNVVRWTEEFARWRAENAGTDAVKDPLHAFTFGAADSPDPHDLILRVENNRVEAPEALGQTTAMRVHAAMVNGEPMQDRTAALQP